MARLPEHRAEGDGAPSDRGEGRSAPLDRGEGDGSPFDGPVPLPIDGTLDLHAFPPGEVGDLVPEWLEACRAAGLVELRIVHGKGTGALRRTVEAILARDPRVRAFRAAGEDAGGWGATLVTLR